jgi:hypothetical protein
MINKVRTKMNMAELIRIQVPTRVTNKFDNLLMGTFSDNEWDDLLPHLSVVDLKVGEVLFKSGENQNFVYFPIDSIVSLMCELENG